MKNKEAIVCTNCSGQRCGMSIKYDFKGFIGKLLHISVVRKTNILEKKNELLEDYCLRQQSCYNKLD